MGSITVLKMNFKTTLYYLGLLILIIISYFLYSPRYYAFLGHQ